mgnify:CR=1 FL=1
MSSVIDVANRALTKLGSARITSLDDDVKAARAVKSCFYDILDAELRKNRWSFAMKRSSLAALSDAPAFGYSYQYQLPTDFLRLDMLDDRYPDVVMDNYINYETSEYAIEGGKILANIEAPLKIRYVYQCYDPSLWDALFKEALACKIAAEICEDLTQSNEKRNLAAGEYKVAILDAIKANAIERPPQALPDDQLIISRI